MLALSSFDWVIESINPWVTILSVILGLVSILIAIYFYLKSKRIKSVSYSVRNFNLIQDFVSKIRLLEMKYSGEKIENLSISKVALWNNGSETIGINDVASLEPITISISPPYKILDTDIIYVKKEANKFNLALNDEKSNIQINFEYVDKNEGAIIQVIHTGKTKDDIKIKGTIKGGSKLSSKYVPQMRDSSIKLRTIYNKTINIGWIYILISITAIVIVIGLFFGPEQRSILPLPKLESEVDRIALITTILLIYLSTFLILGILKLRRILPKGFEIFEEDLD